jgi:spore germination protein YaaH
VSIHHLEHDVHKENAVFTPVLFQVQPFYPLQDRIPGMTKDFYGYCPYWIDTVYHQYFQLDLVTQCAYFSVDIDPQNGSLGGIPNISRFESIRDQAHAQGVVVHMTFTLFGNSNVSLFLNDSSARHNAIENMSAFVANYGIEGVNVDFEFVTSSVRDSFSLFVADLAYAMWNHAGGRKDLYIAMPAVPEWYPGYDYTCLSDNSDGLFIMAYGFHYGGSSIAGPVSPCVPSSFWGQYCCARSIGSYLLYGADSTKLLLGVPYYGYDWPTETGDMGSNTTGSGTARIYYYAYQEALTYGRIWDDQSLTPWYRYYTTGWHQCWYDDSASLDVKLGLVIDSIIHGAGCWALGYDRSYDHLWNTIRRRFWDPSLVTESQNTTILTLCVPNPVTTTVWTIKGFDENRSYTISLYDVSGRSVLTLQHSGKRTRMIGEDLGAGIFMILIRSSHAVFSAKVVKLTH